MADACADCGAEDPNYVINGARYCRRCGPKRWHEANERQERELDAIFGPARKPPRDHEMARIRKMEDPAQQARALLARAGRPGRCPSGDHAADECETFEECREAHDVLAKLASGEIQIIACARTPPPPKRAAGEHEKRLAPALTARGYAPSTSKPGLWLREERGVRYCADFRKEPRGAFYAFSGLNDRVDASDEERAVRIAADQSQRRLPMEP